MHRCRLGAAHEHGLFVAPTVIELPRAAALTREVFGPVLHVVRYRPERLDELVDEINGLGYGLTLGVHTRIDATAKAVAQRARVGNVYVNRNMIGAVVGVQPFGGMGLSGTGPKAGGPHYVPRFAIERTVTTNTAAVGGNATLLSLDAGPGPVARPLSEQTLADSARKRCSQRVRRLRSTRGITGFSRLARGLLSSKRAGSVAVVT